MNITPARTFDDEIHIGVIFKTADIIDKWAREKTVLLKNAGRSMAEVVKANFLNIEIIRYHVAAGGG